jgi:hypothetical protein
VHTSEAQIWIIGMRYKIMNANTTEQVAPVHRRKWKSAQGGLDHGVSSSQQGGLTLDGMVQRLVQKLVWEIDSKHKGQAETPKASAVKENKPDETPKAPAVKKKKSATTAPSSTNK